MSPRTDRVRVLVADGQPLFRDAVTSVLESQDDLVVVALAADGIQAIREAERTEPDVAIVDVNLPNSDGIHTTAAVRDRVPNCRVLVLADGDDHTSLVNAVEAGASGFLTRMAPLTDLIEATRMLHRGESAIPGRLLGGLLTSLVKRRHQQARALRSALSLTPREREVLGMVAEGADNDQIAQRLVISPQTVRTHIHNLLTKLEVHSRLEAAAFVVRNGLRNELGAGV
jgi:DNA-binding NarL/FixJ family response regulator